MIVTIDSQWTSLDDLAGLPFLGMDGITEWCLPRVIPGAEIVEFKGFKDRPDIVKTAAQAFAKRYEDAGVPVIWID